MARNLNLSDNDLSPCCKEQTKQGRSKSTGSLKSNVRGSSSNLPKVKVKTKSLSSNIKKENPSSPHKKVNTSTKVKSNISLSIGKNIGDKDPIQAHIINWTAKKALHNAILCNYAKEFPVRDLKCLSHKELHQK